MRSWFRAVLARNDTPDEVVVQLVKHVMKNFLRQVLHTVNDLRLHFSNLTLDRLGVRESGATGVVREECYVVFASGGNLAIYAEVDGL